MADLRLQALKLLARRDYSRAELRARLLPQADSADALEAELDRLQASQLLSDSRYASQRVAARGQRYGDARLRQELRQRGISDDEIAQALPEAGDECVRCQQVWGRKFGQLPDSPAERARQMRFLQYRGFSATAIRHVLNGMDDE